MKPKRDEAIADVRNARKALCDRFGNDPRHLLKHLREQQQNYTGRVIKMKAPLGATSKTNEQRRSNGNPRCHTIFLPSVQTPSVLKQLKTERDIDQVFDLLAILRNKLRRTEFLEELFKFRLREKI